MGLFSRLLIITNKKNTIKVLESRQQPYIFVDSLMFKAHGGSHSFYFKQVKDFYLLDLIYISQSKTTPTRTTYIYINIFIFRGEIPIPTPPPFLQTNIKNAQRNTHAKHVRIYWNAAVRIIFSLIFTFCHHYITKLHKGQTFKRHIWRALGRH